MSGKVAPKVKGPKGAAAKAYADAVKALGPNPAKNNPLALAALKRRRAADFPRNGAVAANLLASASVLESWAQVNIPRPGAGGGGGRR